MRKPAVTVVLLTIVIASSFGFYLRQIPEQFLDFRAFYCAGEAVRLGADPYREHPLHECEHRVLVSGMSPMRNNVTIPAPFPGFVLGLFSGLARLPFAGALALWFTASIAAIVGSVILVARTTSTSMTANVIAVGYPAAMVALPLGQVTPFIMLSMATTAALLLAARPRLAALAALGALLDPHVGLALWIGVFIGSPPSRRTLSIATLALLAVSLAVAGPSHEWEYLRSVVPAHAVANIADSAQFSATNVAFLAGAAPGLAIAVGSAWYALALLTGVLVAFRLRAVLGPAVFAYVPVAFAVFGGTHTHLQQLDMAVPAFVLLTAQATDWRREVSAVATFMAATPWLFVVYFPWLFFGPPTMAYLFAREMRVAWQGIRLGAASLIILMISLIAVIRGFVDRGRVDAIITGNPLAEVSWQIFTLAKNVPSQPWFWVAKGPTVVAFMVLFAMLVQTAARRIVVRVEC